MVKVQKGVDKEHDEDDIKLFPVLYYCREYSGDLDHPWDRSPKSPKNSVPQGLFILWDLVGTILLEPLLGLLFTKPFFDIDPQLRRYLEPGKFLVILGLFHPNLLSARSNPSLNVG